MAACPPLPFQAESWEAERAGGGKKVICRKEGGLSLGCGTMKSKLQDCTAAEVPGSHEQASRMTGPCISIQVERRQREHILRVSYYKGLIFHSSKQP